jgi:SAM-dependent methyltransferase
VSGGIEPSAARFLGRVDDYVRYRPSYPAAAIAAILDGLQRSAPPAVVDVGAGSGIGSRLLAEHGARVVAIEPNPEMREAAAAAGIDVRDGTAERTGLPGSSADVVSVFQAFHWFATAEAVAEFARVLRRGGRVAVVFNVRDERDNATAAYGQIVASLRATSRGARSHDDLDVRGMLASGGFARVRHREFRLAQPLDREGLLGRARSASYVPREGPAYDDVVRRLDAMRERFAPAGIVTLVHRTHVFLGDRT